LEEGEVDEGLLFAVHVSVAVVLFVVLGFVVQGNQVVAVGQRAFVAVLQFEHLGFDFGADVGDLFVAWVRGGGTVAEQGFELLEVGLEVGFYLFIAFGGIGEVVEFAEFLGAVAVHVSACEVVGDFVLWVVDGELFVFELGEGGGTFWVRRSRRNWRRVSR
jgi:hypothetical protein